MSTVAVSARAIDAAGLLIEEAAKHGADKLLNVEFVIKLSDVGIDGRPVGDWQIEVKRVA